MDVEALVDRFEMLADGGGGDPEPLADLGVGQAFGDESEHLALAGGQPLEWQQLRASAALFVEWLRISYRQGWLGDEPVNLKSPRCTMQKGTEAATRLRQFRTMIGLNAPYGETAARVYRTRAYRRTPHERWAIQCRWNERCKQREQDAHEAEQAAA